MGIPWLERNRKQLSNPSMTRSADKLACWTGRIQLKLRASYLAAGGTPYDGWAALHREACARENIRR
jgi:hypothetical protein